MSNPGFPAGISTQQLTPEFLQQMQQYQDQQKKMQLAQGLMGNKAQGQYSGLANAGSDLAGALASQNIGAANSPAAQAISLRTGISPSAAGNIVNPSMLSQAKNWAGNLFGMGGGS